MAGMDSPDYYWVASAADMFQQKIDKTFKDLINVFGIADNILNVGYDADGWDHDRTLKQVISRQGAQPCLKKMHALIEIPQ